MNIGTHVIDPVNGNLYTVIAVNGETATATVNSNPDRTVTLTHEDFGQDKAAELMADAKLVYNGGNLLVLAEKYGVTTQRIEMHKRGEVPGPALATNSDRKEVQSKLYAAIKGQLRGLGVN